MTNLKENIYKFAIIPLSIFNFCYGFGAKVYFFAPLFLLILALSAVVNIYILLDKNTKTKRQNIFLLVFAIFTALFFCGFILLSVLTPYALSYYFRGAFQSFCFLCIIGFFYLLLFHNKLFKNKKLKITIIAVTAIIGIIGFLDLAVMKINGKPVVFDAGNGNYTIVFSTNTNSIGSLFYEKDGEVTELVDTQNGIKKVSKVHKITIAKEELLNATYYVQAQNALIYQPHNRYISLIKQTSKKIKFRDLSEKDTIDYVVISDTHNALNNRHTPMDTSNIDFFVYLGDIVSFLEEERDLAELINIMHNGSKGEAVCYFVIGNHEKRGLYSSKIMDYIVTPNGKLNYTFEYKDFLGIVMDTGEDHTDDGWIFNGNADYSSYSKEQTEWLTNSEDYLIESVKTKVFFGHVPFYDFEKSSSGKEFENWISILEKANVKMIINGHDHNFKFFESYEGIEELETTAGLTLNIPNILAAGKTKNFTSNYHTSVISQNHESIIFKNYLTTKRKLKLKDTITIALR